LAFKFKQFQVEHSYAFKVGTDGVLLGAWAEPNGAEQILDIGTGTGLLALMCAQKNPTAFIDAIEIDRDSVMEAEKNFEHSPWGNRMSVQFTNLKKFSREHPESYDYIICNPPYFSESSPSPNPAKALAKQGINFSLKNFVASSCELLQQHGMLALILPHQEHEKFEAIAEEHHLHCFRKLIAYKKEGHEAAFILSEWSFDEHETTVETINIRDKEGEYSKEHNELTEAFYLDREEKS